MTGIRQQLPQKQSQPHFVASHIALQAPLLDNARVREAAHRMAGDINRAAALERKCVGHPS